MNKDFLKEREAELIAERAKLLDEVARVAPHGATENEAFDADYNTLGDKEDESADKAAEIGDNLSLENELSTALRDVEGALKAIAAGTYGICKYCKQAIDEARLRIRPTSTSCVACKKTLTQEM
jgi:DnaK suppressor protein